MDPESAVAKHMPRRYDPYYPARVIAERGKWKREPWSSRLRNVDDGHGGVQQGTRENKVCDGDGSLQPVRAAEMYRVELAPVPAPVSDGEPKLTASGEDGIEETAVMDGKPAVAREPRARKNPATVKEKTGGKRAKAAVTGAKEKKAKKIKTMKAGAKKPKRKE